MHGTQRQGSLEVKAWSLHVLGYNIGFDTSYETLESGFVLSASITLVVKQLSLSNVKTNLADMLRALSSLWHMLRILIMRLKEREP